MKSFWKPLVVCAAALSLAACGESVQVPPAYVGKILSKDGFQPGQIAPSQFRLPICFRYCDRLIVVESSDFGLREAFRDDHALYMPKSQLTMPFDVRGTFAVNNNDKALQSVFDRIPAATPRQPRVACCAAGYTATSARNAFTRPTASPWCAMWFAE